MDLKTTDLIVDKVYEGSRNGNASDDPLPHLLGVDNSAGFRHLGRRPEVSTLKLLVLKTSFDDTEWPDTIDKESGHFIYYGDNKSVNEIHDTPRQGNLILKNLFAARHSNETLENFPPIFLFSGLKKQYRDVRFLGLAVPGTQSMGQDEDLVAVWRSSGIDSLRFQNYKSTFTILDVPSVSRAWISDIQIGNAISSPHAPKAWLDWVKARKYTPLNAPHSIEIQSKEQQLPQNKSDGEILKAVYSKFKDSPYDFERCAIEIARLSLPSIGSCDLTRPWRDGGRDAVGYYQIGSGRGSIDVEFALEAKCYQTTSGVGVKELSRLISRLRHRQFGILVTTSYLSSQAYRELKEDDHPVVVISANNIVTLLKEKIGDILYITDWLNRF